MNLLDYGSSSDDETESSSLTQQKPPHSYTHKSASFSTTTIETTPLDAKKHSEFVKKSREFDLTHDVLPEEVTVHHLDMPHESDGHHYLRGHKDSSSGSGSSTTSKAQAKKKMKLPSAADLLSGGKATVQFSVSVSSTSTSTSTKQSGSVKSPEAKLSSEFLCYLYVIYSLRYSFPYHTLIH